MTTNNKHVGLGSARAYMALASHLRDVRTTTNIATRMIYDQLIHQLADSLASESHRFNKEKFLYDCGL